MTPAELKEARRRLGLSASEMAAALTDPDPRNRADPVNPRTVRRWEDGSQYIPGPVVVAVTLMLRLKAAGRSPFLVDPRRRRKPPTGS